MIKKEENLWAFISWLTAILNNEGGVKDSFELIEFGWWKEDRVNVPVRINNNSLEIFVPLENLWISVFFSFYSKKSLLDVILLDGLDKIKKTYKKYDFARMLFQDDKLRLSDVESIALPHGGYSFFKKETGCLDFVEIWRVQRSETEVISRIGKDNLIESFHEIRFGVFISGQYIDDPYLSSFLPDTLFITESDYGFIPSSAKNVSFDISIDKNISETFRSGYSANDHYNKLLETNYRKINLHLDNSCFKLL